MASFDDDSNAATVPETFGLLYAKWRRMGRGQGTPILEFVTWVETTMGAKICDLGTEADMQALHAELVAQAGEGNEDVAEMLWQGMEGGP